MFDIAGLSIDRERVSWFKGRCYAEVLCPHCIRQQLVSERAAAVYTDVLRKM